MLPAAGININGGEGWLLQGYVMFDLEYFLQMQLQGKGA